MRSRSRYQRRARGRIMATINIVPYVDVMLVLLVIFMVTTPLLTQGVKIDLPKATSQAISDQQKALVVSINKQGQLYYNQSIIKNKPLPMASLIMQLKDQNHQQTLLIRADQSIAYGKVVSLMAQLQQSGWHKLGLLSDAQKTTV